MRRGQTARIIPLMDDQRSPGGGSGGANASGAIGPSSASL
jgi:hypothetical protein